MNKNLHAHVSTFSRDCDGSYSYDYVVGFNDDERAEQVRAYFNGVMRGYDEGVNDFSEIHFMNRVLTNLCSPYGVEHGSTVAIGESGFEYRETTDEGYRQGEAEWCRKDCRY